MIFKWFGPLALLAALVIGDQIRINRPDHKYRLTVEVETPEGVKSASGVMAVHPDRSYSRGGQTRTVGRCRFRRSRRRQKPRRAAGAFDKNARSRRHQLCGACAPTRRPAATGVVQRDEPADRHRAGEGRLIPVLVTFADPADPATARVVAPDEPKRRWGRAIVFRASRPRWCRTDSGRSISAARWASP